MVMAKYSTGCSIIPKPARWVAEVRPLVDPLLSLASPVVIWQTYGSLYTHPATSDVESCAGASGERAGSGRPSQDPSLLCNAHRAFPCLVMQCAPRLGILVATPCPDQHQRGCEHPIRHRYGGCPFFPWKLRAVQD